MRVAKIIFLLLIGACLGSPAAGADWVKQSTNSFAWYRDIEFVTKERGWIVGTDGVMLTTDDGGRSWQPRQRTTTDTILQVHFTDESTGWLLCQRNVYARGRDPLSYLQKTTNGGRTWEKIEFQDAGRERVTRLLFGANERAMGFGEGGYTYQLQDDGVTWKRFSLAIHFLLLDGAYDGDNIGAVVGAGGTVMFTEDGGLTWGSATLIGDTDAKLNAIAFSGATKARGWAVGNGGKIFRSNAGAKLWRQQPQITSANLHDVHFTNASNGWIVGDEGLILRTRDGGNTWTQASSGTTHKLEKIVFHDGRGFAIGHGGTILVYDDSVRNADTPREKPVLQKRN